MSSPRGALRNTVSVRDLDLRPARRTRRSLVRSPVVCTTHPATPGERATHGYGSRRSAVRAMPRASPRRTVSISMPRARSSSVVRRCRPTSASSTRTTRTTSSCISTITRRIRRHAARSHSFRCCLVWGCALFSRQRQGWVVLAILLFGCEIEKVGIPSTEAKVALHAVLSASAPSQVVLLERTRNGTLTVTAPSFEMPDPILSDEGIAESNAIVTMTTPSGRTLLAREDATVRRSEEHTSELQSLAYLVCRLLLEK